MKALIKKMLPILTILFNRRRKYRGNNAIVFSKSVFYKTKQLFYGRNNRISGSESILRKCRFNIYGSNNSIEIGRKCTLIDVEFWIEGNGNKVIIGDECDFRGQTQLAVVEKTSLTIGNGCLFSSEILIRTGDSHSIIGIDGKRMNPAQSVVVGDQVWVGTRVIILKGVQIASNCIIGAGSIITKAYAESNSIIAGNPAKVVKTGITWSKKLL